MEKLKYILLAFVIFMTNCDDEAIIDYLPKGEWYFWIVNGTEHTIKIKIDRGININNRPENYEIPPADSIVTAESNGSEYWPFCDHNALILIDDTLAYSCQSYCLSEDCSYDEKCYGEMFLHSRNYEIVMHSEKLHIFRYEFTEKEYEFAKAHPYKPEEE